MKRYQKILACLTFVGLIAASAFADPPKKATSSKEALSIVEALQTTFRSVSDTMLPAVVEVDVSNFNTPIIVIGIDIIVDAKITGITPAEFILIGIKLCAFP